MDEDAAGANGVIGRFACFFCPSREREVRTLEGPWALARDHGGYLRDRSNSPVPGGSRLGSSASGPGKSGVEPRPGQSGARRFQVGSCQWGWPARGPCGARRGPRLSEIRNREHDGQDGRQPGRPQSIAVQPAITQMRARFVQLLSVLARRADFVAAAGSLIVPHIISARANSPPGSCQQSAKNACASALREKGRGRYRDAD